MALCYEEFFDILLVDISKGVFHEHSLLVKGLGHAEHVSTLRIHFEILRRGDLERLIFASILEKMLINNTTLTCYILLERK